jgi:hypothetical protein
MKMLVILICMVFVATPMSPIFVIDKENLDETTKEYDLSIKDKQGAVDYYKIRTVYYHGNAIGITQNRDELIAVFKREVLKILEDSHLVKYTWANSKLGHANSLKGEITDWKTLTFSNGFTYSLDLEDRRFPECIDFKPVPNSMDGFRFMVNILDAHAQFELLRTEANGNISDLKRVGDRVDCPDAHHTAILDFPPFSTDSTFTNGDYDTVFMGIWNKDGKKLAVLEYNNSESKLTNTVNWNPQWAFIQRGTSNYWGHVYIDLESGKLAKGDLFEYVVIEMESKGLENSLRLFERRIIEIQKITKDEFERF